MAITQAMTQSFKTEILRAVHDFTVSTGDSFKMSLYTSAATLDATTTAYTATNETSGTNYTATGNALTNALTPTWNTTGGAAAITDFDDEVWGTASFTARGALIYNDTAAGDPSVVVLDFGSDKTATAGDFTVQFPAADAGNAIIRIA
jgi:hypothetical protein